MIRRNSLRFTAPLLGLTLGLIAVANPSHAQNVTGNWLFDGNFSANIGTASNAVGTWSFDTSTIGGATAQVARFDASTVNSYLDVAHGVAANGGGTKANQYSIIMDISLDALTGFVSLYQTNSTATSTDGDWFVRGDGGMGISSNYTDDGNALRFQAPLWQRLALVIDTTTPTSAGSDVTTTTYRSYINGSLQNVVQSPGGWGVDGRYSLNNNVFLLADEDGEIQSGLINNLQVRNYAMSADEISLLGGPTAGGISTAVVPAPSSLITALVGVIPCLALTMRRFRRKA